MGADVVVDCEGCVAPCCNLVMLVGPDGKPFSEQITLAVWAKAGAELRKIGTAENDQGDTISVYECGALEHGRCSVYENRPGPCRRYTCENDLRFSEIGDTPRCEWPRV